MPQEPRAKRAVGFYDGQNLYHHAKAAFGHYYPNYDPVRLFREICRQQDWIESGVRFYTGVPAADKDPFWHQFWSKKLLALRRAGVLVVQRTLKYQTVRVVDDLGEEKTFTTGQEKGIDVRLALDVVRLALSQQLDIAVVFSQDQDLAEIAKEVREIAKIQDRWIAPCVQAQQPIESAAEPTGASVRPEGATER